jgi:osomolarity two-component system, sensor histidine kinase SLN1
MLISCRSAGLSLTASLKAAQLASDLELLQSTCGTIATRLLIQQSLRSFYQGNYSDSNWANAIVDAESALSSGGSSILLQATIFSKNGTGNSHGLLNVTGSVHITLPYNYPNGTVSCALIVLIPMVACPHKKF